MSNDTTIDLSQYFINRGEIEESSKEKDMPCGKKKPKKK